MTKEEYLPYLTGEEVKQIERVCGKDWKVENIPAFIRREIEQYLAEEAAAEEWEDARRENPQTEEERLAEEFGDAPSY